MVFALCLDTSTVWTIFFLWNFEPRRKAHWPGLRSIITVAFRRAESTLPNYWIFLVTRNDAGFTVNTHQCCRHDAISWFPLFGFAWILKTATTISRSISGLINFRTLRLFLHENAVVLSAVGFEEGYQLVSTAAGSDPCGPKRPMIKCRPLQETMNKSYQAA